MEGFISVRTWKTGLNDSISFSPFHRRFTSGCDLSSAIPIIISPPSAFAKATACFCRDAGLIAASLRSKKWFSSLPDKSSDSSRGVIQNYALG